jgi:hypothetical protein
MAMEAPVDPEAQALRDADIAALSRRQVVFQPGAKTGLAYLIDNAPAVAPKWQEDSWAKLRPRLNARLSGLTPLSPLASNLAQGAAAPSPLDALRRASAMQGFQYLLIYQVNARANKSGGGLFGGGTWKSEGLAQFALLDVTSGRILASGDGRSAAAAASEKEKAEALANEAALTAMASALENELRRLDTEAMRASGPRLDPPSAP